MEVALGELLRCSGGGGWGGVVVGWDPVGDGRADVAVVPPTNDQVVFVGGGLGGWFSC